jgi:probable HAF family extracellular repeat protein
MKRRLEAKVRFAKSAMLVSILAILIVGVAGAFAQTMYSITDLGTFGGTYSYVRGINNNAQIVGYASTAGNAADHAYRYSGGTMSDLGTLGGTDSQAHGINNNGQVVGYAYTAGNAAQHAFLYSGGAMHDLGTLGGTYSYAYGINDNAQVVGYAYRFGNTVRHAFLYNGGTMIDLGTLGGTTSIAHGINNNGQVVGDAMTAGNAAERAFLYSGGTMRDLNNAVTPGSGWTLVEADAINDNGDIVGWGTNPSGQIHAFLLTQIPEPGSFSLLLLGGAALLFRRNAARR